MGVVSGYTLDLYCDNTNKHESGWYNENVRFPVQYYADGKGCEANVRKQARQAGWKFHRNGTVTCPICNLKNKK